MELSEEVTIGVNDIQNFQTVPIHIYPNPVTENIYVEGTELHCAEIYDALGKKYHPIVSLSHHLIPISHLQAGVYLKILLKRKSNNYQVISDFEVIFQFYKNIKTEWLIRNEFFRF
jgi:hypothetical protein